jgi:hypothetical protein
MIRALLASIALSSVLLGGCSLLDGDEEPADRPVVVGIGEVVEGHAVLPDVSDGIEVRLPSGPAYFRVDDDLSAVPDDEAPGMLEDEPVAEGGRLLRLAWGRKFLGYGSDLREVMTGSTVEDVGLDVELTVVADGQRVEVPEVGRLDGIGDPDHVYVGLPGGADDVTLEVAYDGVTQTVDLTTQEVEPDRAAGLYDVPLSGESEFGDGGGHCPYPDREQGLEISFACGVLDSWQVPYVDGLGWAGAGRSWLVADASSTLMSLWWISGNDYTDYRTRLRSWQVLADGSDPVGTLPRHLGNQPQDKRLVFAVEPGPRHRIDFRASFVGRRIGPGLPGAPARPTVHLERTLRVPQADPES